MIRSRIELLHSAVLAFALQLNYGQFWEFEAKIHCTHCLCWIRVSGSKSLYPWGIVTKGMNFVGCEVKSSATALRFCISTGDGIRVLAFCCFAAFWWAFLAYSAGVSRVLYLEQTWSLKRCRSWPSVFVTPSKKDRDDEICICSLANACQVASMKMRSRIIFSHDFPNSAAKHGSTHWFMVDRGKDDNGSVYSPGVYPQSFEQQVSS